MQQVFIAGPESPPVIFASTGLLVLISTAIPTSVFITDTALHPESSAIFAKVVMSVTFGDNFAITGNDVAFLTPS